MINRYSNRRVVKNSSEMYDNTFSERNVKFINHYETAKFIYPNENNIGTLTLVNHVWSLGDRFYKLAHQYYGDAKDWWIIAKFNNLPTESHVLLGDVILIPTPIEQVILVMKG